MLLTEEESDDHTQIGLDQSVITIYKLGKSRPTVRIRKRRSGRCDETQKMMMINRIRELLGLIKILRIKEN